MLREHFDVEMLRAGSPDEARQLAESHAVDLILVNRLLDADGSEGLQIISAMKSGSVTKAVPVMLVSNFPDAQQAAVEAGALPGFGKDSLNVPATIERLGSVLN